MSIARGSILFSLGTLFSRIFGLLRESIIAGVFGANFLLDAFFVANRIPNMLRELLAEGALGSAFTKVFSNLVDEDRQRAHKLLIDSLWFFSVIAIAITLLGFFFAPTLVELLTISRKNSQETDIFFHQTVYLTRLLFPFIGFMMIGAIAGGALHQQGRFFLSAIVPIILNVGYVLGALFFAPFLTHQKNNFPLIANLDLDLGMLGLALGVLVGGLGQTIAQLLSLWKPFLKGKSLLPTHLPWSSDIHKILSLMGPMIIGASAGQINVLVNTNFATSLGEGAVSWLTFSFRVLQLPIGLFGVAVGIAALPALTKAISKAGRVDDKGVSSELGRAIEFMLWLMVPCFCFFLVNSEAIVQLLFQHGQFDSIAAKGTAQALYAYSFGLLGYGLIKVLTSFYYAAERTSFAMKVSLASIAVNFIGNYLLVKNFGHVGLALTASVVLNLNALILLAGLRVSKVVIDFFAVGRFLGLLITAALLSIFFQKLWLTEGIQIYFASMAIKTQAFWHLFINGICVSLVFTVFAVVSLKIKISYLKSFILGINRR